MRALAVLSCCAIACAQSASPDLAVQSAPLSSGGANFSFLPPLAAGAAVAGSLDAGLSPEVQITDASGAMVARFTTSGSGAQRVRLDPDCNCWTVNWNTPSAAGAFRIRVLQGSVELGAIAVQTGKGAPFNAGRTIPIKFVANLCAAVVCGSADACQPAGVCQASTGTCTHPVLGDGAACTASFGAGVCQAGTCVSPVTAPANLAVALGDDGVHVTWDASAEATSYAVFRAMSAGGPWELAGVTTGLSLIDPSPEAGVANLYAVEARNGSAGARSGPVSILIRPAAPAGLAAAFGQGEVSLSWTPARGADSYLLLRGTVPGGPQEERATIADAHFTDGGLENGTTYYYSVRAKNGAGAGPASAPVAATPHYQCVDGHVQGDDPSRLLGISLDPEAKNVIAGGGTSAQLHASGYYRQNPWQAVDITGSATWTSTDASIASVSAGLLTWGATAGEVTVTATLSGISKSLRVRVWDAARFDQLTALSASAPGVWNMSSGGCAAVSMTASFSDGTSEDVTQDAVWGSNCWGKVMGQDLYVANGPCAEGYGSFTSSLGIGTLTARVDTAVWGVHLSGSCSDPRSPGALWGIQVNGGGTMYVGEARQFGAQGLFEDGAMRDISDRVEYDTCNPALLQMDHDGLGTGRGVGNGYVGAAILDGVSGTGNVSVVTPPSLGTATSVQISPGAANPRQGATYQMRALATFTGAGGTFNVTGAATWASSDPAVAPFAAGVGSGSAPGKATISAGYAGFAAGANVRVWDPARLDALTGFSIAGEGNMSGGASQQWHLYANFSSGDAQEEVSDSSMWWPGASCYGHLSTTGFFTADGPCRGYDIIWTWLGRGIGRPMPIEFGIW